MNPNMQNNPFAMPDDRERVKWQVTNERIQGYNPTVYMAKAAPDTTSDVLGVPNNHISTSLYYNDSESTGENLIVRDYTRQRRTPFIPREVKFDPTTLLQVADRGSLGHIAQHALNGRQLTLSIASKRKLNEAIRFVTPDSTPVSLMLHKDVAMHPNKKHKTTCALPRMSREGHIYMSPQQSFSASGAKNARVKEYIYALDRLYHWAPDLATPLMAVLGGAESGSYEAWRDAFILYYADSDDRKASIRETPQQADQVAAFVEQQIDGGEFKQSDELEEAMTQAMVLRDNSTALVLGVAAGIMAMVLLWQTGPNPSKLATQLSNMVGDMIPQRYVAGLNVGDFMRGWTTVIKNWTPSWLYRVLSAMTDFPTQIAGFFWDVADDSGRDKAAFASALGLYLLPAWLTGSVVYAYVSQNEIRQCPHGMYSLCIAPYEDVLSRTAVMQSHLDALTSCYTNLEMYLNTMPHQLIHIDDAYMTFLLIPLPPKVDLVWQRYERLKLTLCEMVRAKQQGRTLGVLIHLKDLGVMVPEPMARVLDGGAGIPQDAVQGNRMGRNEAIPRHNPQVVKTMVQSFTHLSGMTQEFMEWGGFEVIYFLGQYDRGYGAIIRAMLTSLVSLGLTRFSHKRRVGTALSNLLGSVAYNTLVGARNPLISRVGLLVFAAHWLYNVKHQAHALMQRVSTLSPKNLIPGILQTGGLVVSAWQLYQVSSIWYGGGLFIIDLDRPAPAEPQREIVGYAAQGGYMSVLGMAPLGSVIYSVKLARHWLSGGAYMDFVSPEDALSLEAAEHTAATVIHQVSEHGVEGGDVANVASSIFQRLGPQFATTSMTGLGELTPRHLLVGLALLALTGSGLYKILWDVAQQRGAAPEVVGDDAGVAQNLGVIAVAQNNAGDEEGKDDGPQPGGLGIDNVGEVAQQLHDNLGDDAIPMVFEALAVAIYEAAMVIPVPQLFHNYGGAEVEEEEKGEAEEEADEQGVEAADEQGVEAAGEPVVQADDDEKAEVQVDAAIANAIHGNAASLENFESYRIDVRGEEAVIAAMGAENLPVDATVRELLVSVTGLESRLLWGGEPAAQLYQRLMHLIEEGWYPLLKQTERQTRADETLNSVELWTRFLDILGAPNVGE